MRLLGKKVSFFIYDFDGVMTDNRALLYQDGKEAVFINRSDGIAIEKIKSLNIKQLIISSEKNPIVLERAKKLNIPAINGVKDKAKELKKYIHNDSLLQETAFVGNDINDLDVMMLVNLKITPSDASKEILNIADYITSAKGGYGVIREIYNKLLEENS